MIPTAPISSTASAACGGGDCFFGANYLVDNVDSGLDLASY